KRSVPERAARAGSPDSIGKRSRLLPTDEQVLLAATERPSEGLGRPLPDSAPGGPVAPISSPALTKTAAEAPSATPWSFDARSREAPAGRLHGTGWPTGIR